MRPSQYSMTRPSSAVRAPMLNSAASKIHSQWESVPGCRRAFTTESIINFPIQSPATGRSLIRARTKFCNDQLAAYVAHSNANRCVYFSRLEVDSSGLPSKYSSSVPYVCLVSDLSVSDTVAGVMSTARAVQSSGHDYPTYSRHPFFNPESGDKHPMLRSLDFKNRYNERVSQKLCS